MSARWRVLGAAVALLAAVSCDGSESMGVENLAPTAADAAVETPKNVPAEVPLVASDPDGDPLTLHVAEPPAHGTVSIEGSMATFSPEPGYVGTDAFRFEATDGEAVATATVTVEVIDRAPELELETEVVRSAAGTPLTIVIQATDPDGDPISFELTTPPSHGTVTGLGTASVAGGAGPATAPQETSLTYTPDTGWSGGDSFGFRAVGGEGVTDEVMISIEANTPPEAVDATVETSLNEPVTITLTGSDGDGDALTFEVVDPPAHGSLSGVTSTGPYSAVVEYTPAEGTAGVATFTYVADDGVDESEPATVEIGVENGVPTAEDRQVETMQGEAVEVVLHGSDPDGDALTFEVVDGPSHGALSAMEGTGPTAAVVTYTPADGFSGIDVFTYRANDGVTVTGGAGGPAAVAGETATVQVAVRGNPTTEDVEAGTSEDAPVEITLTGFDPNGGSLTFAILSGPGHGSLGVPIAGGNPVDRATLRYTPDPDFHGEDEFTFRVENVFGLTAEATASVHVAPVNDAPQFVAGGDRTVPEDEGLQTVIDWAESVSPGPPSESVQTVTFEITDNTNPDLFAEQPAVSGDGTLTYTPADDANGTATITLQAIDDGGTANGGEDTSAPASFDITVLPVNDAPTFTPGPDQTVLESAGPRSELWASDVSPGPADESDQVLTFTVTGNTNPDLFAAAPEVDPDGTLTYTPADGASGEATLTVVLSDDGGTASGGADTSGPAEFTITVAEVNDAPSFEAGDDQSVSEDAGPQSVTEWATAISAGPPAESDQAVTFEITDNTNPDLFAALPAVSPDGTLTYTPADDANGTATIEVHAVDDGGTANGGEDTSAEQSFVITVSAVNDPPSFTPGSDQSVPEDAGPQEESAWATDISAGPPDESGQSVTFEVTGNTNEDLFATLPLVAPDGTLTYEPAAETSGEATITLRAVDNGGGDDASDPITFTITVNAVNDPPTFDPGGDQTVAEDSGPQEVATWATNISPGPADESGQSVTFEVTGNTNEPLFAVQPAVSNDGTLTYTPADDAAGSAEITVEAVDDGGTDDGDDTSDPVTFTITVTPVDDAPVAVAQSLDAEEGVPLLITLEGVEVDGESLVFSITGGPDRGGLGSVTPTGPTTATVTYTPESDPPATNDRSTPADYATQFAFTVDDGTSSSDPVTVDIDVDATNDRPTVSLDEMVVNQPGDPEPDVFTVAVGPGGDVTLPFLFDDEEAEEADGDARAPYFFRLEVITIPPTPDLGLDYPPPNFDWRNFDPNDIATESILVPPLFEAGIYGYIQWSTSVGRTNRLLDGLQFRTNYDGLYRLELVVIDNGFLGSCPSDLTPPDPSEPTSFDLNDYRRVVGREGDLVDGDPDRCIRETTTVIEFQHTEGDGEMQILTFGSNSPPTFVPGPSLTVEGPTPREYVGWASEISAGNIIGEDHPTFGQDVTFLVIGNTDTSLFASGPAVSPDGTLTFTPEPGEFGTATITLVLEDDGPGTLRSEEETFTITVTPRLPP